MIFVGIDVSKAKHDCCIIDSNGSALTDSLRIYNSKEGFETLYSAILSLLDHDDISKVKIGLESTGHYSTNITNYLYSKGFDIHTLNPLATNPFRKAGILRKTETNKLTPKSLRLFPKLPDLFWSIHQASSYTLLPELPTPNDIKSCHLTKLTNIIS